METNSLMMSLSFIFSFCLCIFLALLISYQCWSDIKAPALSSVEHNDINKLQWPMCALHLSNQKFFGHPHTQTHTCMCKNPRYMLYINGWLICCGDQRPKTGESLTFALDTSPAFFGMGAKVLDANFLNFSMEMCCRDIMDAYCRQLQIWVNMIPPVI